MSRLWDKGEPIDALVLRFTAGEDPVLDQRLVAFDVQASTAHARMLRECGHLDEAECTALIDALAQIGREHAAGLWSISPEEEDVHTALERRLIQRLGALGGRIHTARSRNDQVLAALRLYLRDAVAALRRAGAEVVSGLESLARSQGTIPLPGYTHLQRAMPSTVALWAGGFAAEIADDLRGLGESAVRWERSPLGSAAGYGVPVLAIDRERTAQLLGFPAVHEPVTAVQLSRGKAEATILFELTLLCQDLGRLSSDIILFATAEFAFVRLPRELTTGSSIMPQKRNPDVFELVRARAAEVSGLLSTALQLTAKLTSGYHRDLQLLKKCTFQGLDVAMDVLRIMAHAIPRLEFDPEATRRAMDPSLYATERAYRLVAGGVPFREAYRRVAAELAGPGPESGSAALGRSGEDAAPPEVTGSA